jgi:hypothetical protein
MLAMWKRFKSWFTHHFADVRNEYAGSAGGMPESETEYNAATAISQALSGKVIEYDQIRHNARIEILEGYLKSKTISKRNRRLFELELQRRKARIN